MIILLIEDSEADVMLTTLALNEAGLTFDLVVLNDGAKALEYIAQTDSGLPDIVLLDLNIPRVGGLEILEKMRSTERFAAVPVIVLSSVQFPRAKSEVLQKGNAKFMLKPSHLEGYMDLGRRIKDSLGLDA